MQTIPQQPSTGTIPPLDIGTAQHTALLRWHNREPVGDVVDALVANPHYPCIDGAAAAEGA